MSIQRLVHECPQQPVLKRQSPSPHGLSARKSSPFNCTVAAQGHLMTYSQSLLQPLNDIQILAHFNSRRTKSSLRSSGLHTRSCRTTSSLHPTLSPLLSSPADGVAFLRISFKWNHAVHIIFLSSSTQHNQFCPHYCMHQFFILFYQASFRALICHL